MHLADVLIARAMQIRFAMDSSGVTNARRANVSLNRRSQLLFIQSPTAKLREREREREKVSNNARERLLKRGAAAALPAPLFNRDPSHLVSHLIYLAARAITRVP